MLPSSFPVPLSYSLSHPPILTIQLFLYKASLFNKPYTFYMAIDLTPGSASLRWSFAFGNTFYTPLSYPTITYDPTWAFDSSTVISVCSDVNGNYAANCIVQNLKVSYSIPFQFVTMPFSNIRSCTFEFSINFFSSHPRRL